MTYPIDDDDDEKRSRCLVSEICLAVQSEHCFVHRVIPFDVCIASMVLLDDRHVGRMRDLQNKLNLIKIILRWFLSHSTIV